MRIPTRWALLAMVLAFIDLPGIVCAEYPPKNAEVDVRFSSSDVPGTREADCLTGAAEDSTKLTPACATAACESGPWCDHCDVVGNWCDNTLFWFGGEAYKSLGDTAQPPGVATGFTDSAGLVGGFNTGLRLFEDLPIRGQIGASYGIYDLQGRDTISPSSPEQQAFITAGFYKRSDILAGDRISWGVVYDQFWAHQWGLRAGELYVGQTRGIAGYALNESHEIGVWGALRTTGDAGASIPGAPVRAMNQYNVYWRYNWDFGGQTMLYLGGNDPADVGSWSFGCLGQAPLGENTALYGNFSYSIPGSAAGTVGSNELEWNVGMGLVYSWGGKTVSPSVSGRKGLPLLPVANNGSFLITN